MFWKLRVYFDCAPSVIDVERLFRDSSAAAGQQQPHLPLPTNDARGGGGGNDSDGRRQRRRDELATGADVRFELRVSVEYSTCVCVCA